MSRRESRYFDASASQVVSMLQRLISTGRLNRGTAQWILENANTALDRIFGVSSWSYEFDQNHSTDMSNIPGLLPKDTPSGVVESIVYASFQVTGGKLGVREFTLRPVGYWAGGYTLGGSLMAYNRDFFDALTLCELLLVVSSGWRPERDCLIIGPDAEFGRAVFLTAWSGGRWIVTTNGSDHTVPREFMGSVILAVDKRSRV